jgi:hypothetical protein
MSILLQPDDLQPGQIITCHNPCTVFSGAPFLVLALNLPYLYVVAVDTAGNPTIANAVFDVRRHSLMAVPQHVIDALRNNWLRVIQAASVPGQAHLPVVPPSLIGEVPGSPNGGGPDHASSPAG